MSTYYNDSKAYRVTIRTYPGNPDDFMAAYYTTGSDLNNSVNFSYGIPLGVPREVFVTTDNINMSVYGYVILEELVGPYTQYKHSIIMNDTDNIFTKGTVDDFMFNYARADIVGMSKLYMDNPPSLDYQETYMLEYRKTYNHIPQTMHFADAQDNKLRVRVILFDAPTGYTKVTDFVEMVRILRCMLLKVGGTIVKATRDDFEYYGKAIVIDLDF